MRWFLFKKIVQKLEQTLKKKTHPPKKTNQNSSFLFFFCIFSWASWNICCVFFNFFPCYQVTPAPFENVCVCVETNGTQNTCQKTKTRQKTRRKKSENFVSSFRYPLFSTLSCLFLLLSLLKLPIGAPESQKVTSDDNGNSNNNRTRKELLWKNVYFAMNDLKNTLNIKSRRL